MNGKKAPDADGTAMLPTPGAILAAGSDGVLVATGKPENANASR